MMGTYSSPIT